MNGFHAGEVAIEIGARLRPVVQAVRRHDAELADQIYRAAKSLALNAAEGGRRGEKDRAYLFRIAVHTCMRPGETDRVKGDLTMAMRAGQGR